MIVTIDKVFRKDIETKYGERQNIGLKIVEETVQDMNGDDIPVNDRWINGFQDKARETDQWQDGMKIKVVIALKKYMSKDGTEKEAINFRLPEDQTSIVESPATDGVAVDNSADVEPDDF